MDNKFDAKELLLRAVLPNDMYWKEDGSLSSSAFKDKNGLSVDRVYDRPLIKAVHCIQEKFSNRSIVSITVEDCTYKGAVVRYKPTANRYHSEIHGSETQIVLSTEQAKHLASVAKKQTN